MTPDDLVRLRHMAEALELAGTFVHGRVRADLDTDVMLRLALVQAIQIVGEAATRISAESKAQAAQIPWAIIPGCAIVWSMPISMWIMTSCGRQRRGRFPICWSRSRHCSKRTD